MANVSKAASLAYHPGFQANDALGVKLLAICRNCPIIVVRLHELCQWSKYIFIVAQFFNFATLGIQINLVPFGIDSINHIVYGIEYLPIFCFRELKHFILLSELFARNSFSGHITADRQNSGEVSVLILDGIIDNFRPALLIISV